MVDISRINLGELDRESLEKVKLMLDISKIQQDIVESQSRVGKIEQDVAESRAMVAKMQKEMAWFPYLQIITTILTGGVVVFLLTKFLQ